MSAYEEPTPIRSDDDLPPGQWSDHDPATNTDNDIPPVLQHWQVLEIDGEAALVDAPIVPEHIDPGHAIADAPDDIVVALLPKRTVSVQPGATAELVVTLLNNGAWPARFRVHVEGWVREQWLSDGAQQVLLQPGEKRNVNLGISPPRAATTTAGDYPIVVVVRASEYPQRVSRLGATLTILPFTNISVAGIRPTTATLHWYRRTARFVAPVTNLSNHAVTLQLQASGAGCAFAFSSQNGGEQSGGLFSVDVQPQQTVPVVVKVQLQAGSALSMRSREIPIRIVAGVAGEARLSRTMGASVECAPLARGWQLATAAGLLLLTLATVGVLAIAARVLLMTASPSPSAPAVAPAAPPPQIVTIILNQPAAGSSAAAGANPGALAQSDAAAENRQQIAGLDPALPLVLPDQVTAPGQPAPRPRALAAVDGSQPQVANPSNPSNLTYAQMFQDVALRYDLDWRMLAAQAYVESGFDTMALGNQGDMGLMQVLPATWREWAPAVGASDPFDAHSNTLVAAAYLDYLRTKVGEQGKFEPKWMLVAYNWGIDKVLTMLKNGQDWEQVPAQRQRYADEILRIAKTIP